MSLRDEIKPYTDVNGYVNPNIVDTTQGRQSDNAVMFTSEYHIMLSLREEDHYTDSDEWAIAVDKCMPVPGLLTRYPHDAGIEGPDDFLAVLAASKVLKRPEVASSMLKYGLAHYGSYNNTPPGVFSLVSCLWRQPQVLAATLAASNKLAWYHLPLVVYTAAIIATSCINTPINSTDPRRLCWLLIKAMSDSFLCKLAAKLWFRRLRKAYSVSTNDAGMRAVATVYYQMGHPFARYWIA